MKKILSLITLLFLCNEAIISQCLWEDLAIRGGNIVAINDAGNIYSCGSNVISGLPGEDSLIGSAILRIKSPLNNWNAVTTGEDHSLAINDLGELYAWGINTYGALGDGTLSNKISIRKITNENDWVNVSASNQRSFAIKSDGSLWGWGYNGDGLLGAGGTSNVLVPTRIGVENNWVKIIAGSLHWLALKSDGSLWAWGNNQYGRLGDGTTTNRTTPVRIGFANDWSKISAGKEHSLAIKNDGSLWAWGRNSFGRLGDGTTTNRSSPVRIGILFDWGQISAGDESSHAIKLNGTRWGWGNNSSNQLGNGLTSQSIIPIQCGNDSDWILVKSGVHGYISSGIKVDGTQKVWGVGAQFISDYYDYTIPKNVICPEYDNSNCWKQSAGNSSIWRLDLNGKIWKSGITSCPSDCNNPTIASAFEFGTIWSEISCRNNHVIALDINDHLWTWGDNASGQLGNGTNTNSYVPIQIEPIYNWISISAGGNHSLAIRDDGTLWAWGNNANGKLGDNSTTNRSTPVQIGSGNNWLKVSAGNVHSLGLKNDGSLWAWGQNDLGQLGNNTTINSFVPVNIGIGSSWDEISAGGKFSIARKSGGSLWAWGQNNYGQLGNGSQNDFFGTLVPNAVSSSGTWIKFAIGNDHVVGIKEDGTLWSWGRPVALGYPTSTYVTIPLQVGIETDWLYVSASTDLSMGIKNDNTLYLWGDNISGKFGDGTFGYQLTPRLMPCSTAISTPLPLQILSFTGKNYQNQNNLIWSSTSELNVSGFEIQRSSDGINFDNIGFVKANNILQNNSNYLFTDYHPYLGFNYYRLSMIDRDGSYSYSKIIHLNSESEEEIKIYPNPGNGIFELSTGLDMSQAIITVYDLTGKNVKANVNDNLVDLSDHISGIYFLKILTRSGNMFNRTLIKN